MTTETTQRADATPAADAAPDTETPPSRDMSPAALAETRCEVREHALVADNPLNAFCDISDAKLRDMLLGLHEPRFDPVRPIEFLGRLNPPQEDAVLVCD